MAAVRTHSISAVSRLCAALVLLVLLTSPAMILAAETRNRTFNIVLDPSLTAGANAAERMVAWMAYGVGLANHVSKKPDLATVPDGRYVPAYSEEVHARELQVQSWRQILKSGKSLNYPYMDEILAFADSGYFREYVWFAHYRQEWGKPEPSLRMHEFIRQNKANIVGHVPQTLAWVEITST